MIADKLAYHDVDVTAFGYEYGQMAQQPLYFRIWQEVCQFDSRVCLNFDQKWHLGLIATGDSFIAGDDKIKAIKEHFPQVLAVEMEGAAIAQAAHALNLPFLVVRAMSDNANHEASISFDEFIVEAGRRSAQALLTLLQSIHD